MQWIIQNQRFLRMAIVVLLVAAIAGPWVFDLIHVPAEYACGGGSVRLYGDFCGFPLSGTWMLMSLVGEVAYRVREIAAGSMPLVELLYIFPVGLVMLLLLLPLVNTFLLALPGRRDRQQAFQVALWAIAAAISLMLLQYAQDAPPWTMWGRTIFILLAPVAFALELAALKGQAGQQPV